MAEPGRFSGEDFRRRVRTAFAAGDAAPGGDHILNPHISELILDSARRPAAVLVPVIDREPEATVLLTVRMGHLRAHAGQIAFPGGRIDPEDAGPEAAAIREAQEEIGLDPSHVEPLALGPHFLTGSGYRIVPVLALVQPNFQLTLNADEVAEVFEVPLSFLMQPANHRQGSRIWNGARRSFFEMPFGDRHIWGITAGILHALYEHLYAREDVHDAELVR